MYLTFPSLLAIAGSQHSSVFDSRLANTERKRFDGDVLESGAILRSPLAIMS